MLFNLLHSHLVEIYFYKSFKTFLWFEQKKNKEKKEIKYLVWNSTQNTARIVSCKTINLTQHGKAEAKCNTNQCLIQLKSNEVIKSLFDFYCKRFFFSDDS